MAPFEALYGRSYRFPICWVEVGERKLIGPKLVDETSKVVHVTTRIFQSSPDNPSNHQNANIQFYAHLSNDHHSKHSHGPSEHMTKLKL